LVADRGEVLAVCSAASAAAEALGIRQFGRVTAISSYPAKRNGRLPTKGSTI
jgi:hypothetical protein